MSSLFNLNDLLAPLTPQEILSRVPSSLLWDRYLGVKIGAKFSVPPVLRDGVVDKNPSGSLFMSSDGNYILYDHAFHKTYNIFTYLRKANPDKNFNQILHMINNDFNLGIGKINNINKSSLNNIKKNHTPMVVTDLKSDIRFSTIIELDPIPYSCDKYSAKMLEYFSPLSVETLEFFEVIEIRGYDMKYKNSKKTIEIPPDELCFAYPNYEWYYENPVGDFNNTPVSWKICRPESPKEKKWVTNSTKYCIDGTYQLAIYESFYNDATGYGDLTKSINSKDSLKECLINQIADYPLVKSLVNELKNGRATKASLYKTCFLTKSRKDVMAFAECGYAAISLQSEFTKFPYYGYLRHLSEWFDQIIINYDNDSVGLMNASSLCQEHDIYLAPHLLVFPSDVKDCFGYE
jgi:hypothetical protein